MNENEIKSLLKLLEDPDENIYNSIKSKFFENEKEFKPILENYWIDSTNELANKRIEQIIDEIHLAESTKNLINWKKNENDNLLNGILIIEKFFDRLEDTDELKNKTENIIAKIWLELNNQLTALEKIKVINHTLFITEKFKYISNKNINYRSIKISTLINEKIFIDKTMAIFYYIIAKRLDIPIYILNANLSGYSILGYIDQTLATAVFSKPDNNIVFFILPTFNGEIWSQNQLIEFAKEKNIQIEPKDFEPLSNTKILKQWVNYKKAFLEKTDYNSFALSNVKKIIDIL